VVAYEPAYRALWDSFARAARNGHFFFQRGYMEYHAERFEDASLLVYAGQQLVALFPANKSADSIFSHQGLTYGGLLIDHSMTAGLMLDAFEMLLASLREQGALRLMYKTMPYIYFREPAQEDLYALSRCGARLVQRDLSSVLALGRPRNYTKGKKYNIAKARKRNLRVERSVNFAGFMALLRNVLHSRHGVTPVHTDAELTLLATRFPDHIRLYCAYERDEILAGALVFVNPTVVHTQYLASSEVGRTAGALDFLIDELASTQFSDREYLSFGISTEEQGRRVNHGLLESKESFGARTIVHDLYELML
jgi:hypothetical protein